MEIPKRKACFARASEQGFMVTVVWRPLEPAPRVVLGGQFSFCGQVGHMVGYRYKGAQLRENHSGLEWGHPGLYQQGLHRDRAGQGE